MIRLISRDKQIPHGFKYLQVETGWSPRRFASFETIVQGLIAHRKGNAALIAKGYSTDHDTVANEVEAFNVRMAQAMGWTSYLTSEGGAGSPLPPSLASRQTSPGQVAAVAAKVKKIWSGVRSINEWLDGNVPAVPQEQSDKRAAVCAACPKNEQGGFEKWFTVPASTAIKNQIEKAAGRNLKTASDDKLNLCAVCLCPLKLMVHVPLEIKLNHLTAEVEAELREVKPPCWVCTEKDGQ